MTTVAERQEKARAALDLALDKAERVLGEGGVVSALQEEYAPLLDVEDRPEDEDALDKIARLAHEGHDNFRGETCEREVCRKIAEFRGLR